MALFRVVMSNANEHLGSSVRAVSGTQKIRVYSNENVYAEVNAVDVVTLEMFTTRSDLEVARGNQAAEGGAV